MVTVTVESSTGRNIEFQDKINGTKMTRAEFVKKIEHGDYKNYYVRKINGVKTPCSKPDGNLSNNLG